jgi:hypothetical protein
MGRVARQLFGPVVALQLLAISYGAVKDTAWLPGDQSWHHNAFVEALTHSGPALWVALVLALGLGYLVQRVWRDREAAAREPATAES